MRGLEVFARERGIEVMDGKIQHVERGPAGIAALVLEDGQRLEADFFIDASGFRSELLGRVLEEPYISFSDSLFNDRAVVGSWQRTDEPTLPYTTAETMDAGWCWRIDHEKEINRGYVYCSSAISDDEARAAGFATRDELLRFVSEGPAGPLAPDAEVWRVALHHGGDGDRVEIALDDRLSPEDVATLARRLERLLHFIAGK